MAQQQGSSLPDTNPPRLPGLTPSLGVGPPGSRLYSQNFVTKLREAERHNQNTPVGKCPPEILNRIASFAGESHSPWINDSFERGPYQSKDHVFVIRLLSHEPAVNLRHMALACSMFRGPAQEALFHAPFLHSEIKKPDIAEDAHYPCQPHHVRVQRFLRTLFRRPDLAERVQKLRIHISRFAELCFCIRAVENTCHCGDEWVLQQCLAQVSQMKINEKRKKILVQDLKRQWYLAMISVVLNLVPNLNHLTIDNHARSNEIDCIFGKVMRCPPLDYPGNLGGLHERYPLDPSYIHGYIRYPPSYYQYEEKLGWETEGISSIPGIASLRSLRIESTTPIRRFPSMANFVPSVTKLYLLLRATDDPEEDRVPMRHYPSEPLRNMTHLRVDAKIHQTGYWTLRFVARLEVQLAAFKGLRHLDIYGEPWGYNQKSPLLAQIEQTSDYHPKNDWKSSFWSTTFHSLVWSLAPVERTLVSLKMPGGFWVLPRLRLVEGAYFSHFRKLEKLEVPKGMLLGTPRTLDPEYLAVQVPRMWEQDRVVEMEPVTPSRQLPRSLRVLRVVDIDPTARVWIGELLSTCRPELPELAGLELVFHRWVGLREREEVLEGLEGMAEEAGVRLACVQ